MKKIVKENKKGKQKTSKFKTFLKAVGCVIVLNEIEKSIREKINSNKK